MYFYLCTRSHNCFMICSLTSDGKNAMEEPKGIVFLSNLLLLFTSCHFCFAPKQRNTVKSTGTMFSVHSQCRACNKAKIWKSQPFLLGKFPAANLLLSFGILCAGASASKVLLSLNTLDWLASVKGSIITIKGISYFQQLSSSGENIGQTS